MSTSDLLEPARVAIALGGEVPACEGMVVWEAWKIDGAFLTDTGKPRGYAFVQGTGRRIGIYSSEAAALAALDFIGNTLNSDGTTTALVKVVIR